MTHEGSVVVSRDAVIIYEVFKIKNPNNGDGTFTYFNTEGEERTKPLTQEGHQVFELEKGSYKLGRNKIEAIIDHTYHRSAVSGGLFELDEERIAMPAEKEGTEITVKYFMRISIGSPHSTFPRFFVSELEPHEKEFGDFWFDTSDPNK